MLILVRNLHLKTTITLPLGGKVHFVYEKKQVMRLPPQSILKNFDWTYLISIPLVPKSLSKKFNKTLEAYVVKVELIKGKKGIPKNVQQIVPIQMQAIIWKVNW